MSDPTVERLGFANYSNATVEHLHRYAIAMELASGKIILDIASGEGYGSHLKSKTALKVFGVDIDKETISHSAAKYKKDNLTYLVGRADKIPIEDNFIDVVVSFETIEHHDLHDEMFVEIKRVLKPNGILIMSSPDKKYYSDKSGYHNKFHIKELYFNEFKSLSQKYFKHSSFYFQKAYNLNSFISNASIFDSMTVYSGVAEGLSMEKIEPLYNIVLACDELSLTIEPSMFNGENVSNEVYKTLLNKRILETKKSTSYKIGNFIIAPFYYLKKLLKT